MKETLARRRALERFLSEHGRSDPDSRHVVSGGGDGTVRVWDLASGKAGRALEGHTGWVNAVAVSPDGRHVVSGGGDGTVRIWDAGDGSEIARWATDAGMMVTACSAVPADPELVVYGDDAGGVNTLRLVGT